MTLPDDVCDWPADALEAFRERAAIMEVDGLQSHRASLWQAERRVRQEWARKATRPGRGDDSGC